MGIITISGDPGSGKSTVAKIVAVRLGFKPAYSMGDLRGKIALEKGMTIDELNKVGEKESFTDKDVDDYQRKLGKNEDNFVIEGRLSFYFIPHSFKIYLETNARIAAERIFKAPKRSDEKIYSSIDDVVNTIKARVESDKRRYQKYYGIDYADRKHYDLIIDTTSLSPEEVAERILFEYNARKK